MHSIHCTASAPLDFDSVIAAITEVFPKTQIVEADWYADRAAKEAEVIKRLGSDSPHAKAPLESLQRVWDEIGLQRGFEVPIRAGLCLYARLDKTGGYFFGKNGFSELDAEPLISVLKRFPLDLQVY